MIQKINESQLVNVLANILKENLDVMWNRQSLRDYVTNGKDAAAIQKIATQLGCSVTGYKEQDDNINVYLASGEELQVTPDTLEMISNWISKKINGAILKKHGDKNYVVSIPKAYNRDLNDSARFIDAKKASKEPWTINDREGAIKAEKEKTLKEGVDESFGQAIKNFSDKVKGGVNDFYSGYKIRPEEQVTKPTQALENAGWQVSKKIGNGNYIIKKITGAFANTDRSENVRGALAALNYFFEKQGKNLRAYVVSTDGGNDPSMAKIMIK